MTDGSIVHLRPRAARGSEPVLLRVKQAAERLNVSERTVWRWVHDGTVPHVRLDGDRMVRIPADLLEEWWQQRLRGIS